MHKRNQLSQFDIDLTLAEQNQLPSHILFEAVQVLSNERKLAHELAQKKKEIEDLLK